MADDRTKFIGENSSDNIAATTNVARNKDGSILERLEDISLELSGTAGIATYPAAAAPADAADLAGVLRAIYNAISHDSGASVVTTQAGLGRLVTKVGDVSGSTDALFTVTGKVLVTLLHGEVTSVVATTTSLQLLTSTGGVALCASTDIVADAAGTLYLVTGDPDDALNGGQTPNADLAASKTGFHPPFVVNDDRLDQIIVGEGTGLIQWDLWYIPLEASASVASAA